MKLFLRETEFSSGWGSLQKMEDLTENSRFVVGMCDLVEIVSISVSPARLLFMLNRMAQLYPSCILPNCPGFESLQGINS